MAKKNLQGHLQPKSLSLQKLRKQHCKRHLQTAKQLWRDDVGERDAGQFLADILQNILAKEKNIDAEFSVEDFTKLSYPDNFFDLIVTSPPYADSRKNTYGGIHPNKYVDWFLPRGEQFLRV